MRGLAILFQNSKIFRVHLLHSCDLKLLIVISYDNGQLATVFQNGQIYSHVIPYRPLIKTF